MEDEQINNAAFEHSRDPENDMRYSADMLRSFVIGAKSEAAKNYWQRGMYSEEQIKQLEQYLKESDTIDMNLVYYFNINKKK